MKHDKMSSNSKQINGFFLKILIFILKLIIYISCLKFDKNNNIIFDMDSKNRTNDISNTIHKNNDNTKFKINFEINNITLRFPYNHYNGNVKENINEYNNVNRNSFYIYKNNINKSSSNRKINLSSILPTNDTLPLRKDDIKYELNNYLKSNYTQKQNIERMNNLSFKECNYK